VALVVWVSRGRLEPREYDLKEYWTWKGVGRPPWFVRAIKARGCSPSEDTEDEASKRGLNMGEEHDSSYERSRMDSSDNKEIIQVVSSVNRPAESRDGTRR
jgi:adenine/guanine/hypoxanthine permease